MKKRIWLLTLALVLQPAVSMAGKNGRAWDKTPDNFSFVDQTGVDLSTLTQSNTITVTGINTKIPISVSGGEYSINGGSFTTSGSNVNNGDTITVRQTSSNQYLTTTHTVLDLNGVTDSFDVTTLENTAPALDTTPDAFSFNDQTDVELSTTVVSNSITIAGINTATSISVSGGQYSVNGGAYTSTASTVNNGDSVSVRLTSSSQYSTSTSAVLNVGGVSDSFDATTVADTTPVEDTTPDAFSFSDQTNAPLNSVIESNTVTINGINTAASISVSSGEYSVNGGNYTSASGFVNNGDSVKVRQTSSTDYSTTTDVTLTVDTVSDTFSVTTEAQASTSLQLPPQSPGNAAFTSEHFSGSDNCTMCHNGLTDNQGQDVSIETDWSATMMANSARDPLWKAKLRSEINRNPHLEDVINDKCTRCHAPMANYEMKTNNEPFKVLDGGILSAGHARHDEAMSGVSCTLCHQITPPSKPITLEETTGKYGISSNKTIYGPFTDLFPNPMVMNTGYTPVFSQHTKESEMCATCHNLKTPYVDDAGNILSTTPETEFPEQMPYTEWLHSDYADAQNTQSCQACHMSRANGVPISNRPMWLAGRDNFAVHEFVGANKLMLGILNDNKEQLGVTATNFADILAATDVMLSGSANLEILNPSLSQGELSFNVKVNSTTGHKLPSAYPSRRVVLHVTVFDSANNVVFESGKVNPNGSIVGVDADETEYTFEPHYDVITSPDQVQVYEAIMGDNNNNVTYTLLRGMTYLKDNRLLPTGFDKNTAPADVAVAGSALNDNDFIGGSDTVTYQISGLASGSYRVNVELVYQTLAFGFAKDLFKDSSAEVNDFKLMFEAADHKAVVIKTQEVTIQ